MASLLSPVHQMLFFFVTISIYYERETSNGISSTCQNHKTIINLMETI